MHNLSFHLTFNCTKRYKYSLQTTPFSQCVRIKRTTARCRGMVSFNIQSKRTRIYRRGIVNLKSLCGLCVIIHNAAKILLKTKQLHKECLFETQSSLPLHPSSFRTFLWLCCSAYAIRSPSCHHFHWLYHFFSVYSLVASNLLAFESAYCVIFWAKQM